MQCDDLRRNYMWVYIRIYYPDTHEIITLLGWGPSYANKIK